MGLSARKQGIRFLLDAVVVIVVVVAVVVVVVAVVVVAVVVITVVVVVVVVFRPVNKRIIITMIKADRIRATIRYQNMYGCVNWQQG